MGTVQSTQTGTTTRGVIRTMNMEEEMREAFRQTYTEDFLNHLEENCGNMTERIWTAFCHGYACGAEDVAKEVERIHRR